MSRSLVEILRLLNPSGRNGFEGLIAELLESLTGRHFNLARSGSQEGRDMSSRQLYANILAVECKRYGETAELNEREMLGELVQAAQAIPDLDFWVLITSRDVPSQLTETLHTTAKFLGIEFFSISSGDGAPSSLEALCGSAQEKFISHPAVQRVVEKREVETLINQIKEHPQFQQRISKLKHTFLSPFIGFENLRFEQNQRFVRSLSSEREARANFGQPINVEDRDIALIERKAAWSFMRDWLNNWEDGHPVLVVLGEEGDGKTWSIVSWLSQSIKNCDQFPAVVFFSSTDVDLQDPADLLSKVISHRLDQMSEEQSRRRLDRWVSKPSAKDPLFLLVLDGINERRSPDWWRTLLEKLAGEPWIDRIGVVATCRTSYWQRYFGSLRHLLVSTFTISQYDDIELNAALARYNLRIDDIPRKLLPLIRKPRYFDLMMKHRARIDKSGDVTVARLIYEDWRDRYGRKQNIPLQDEDFQNVIRKLACAHQNKSSLRSDREVADILPAFSDCQRIFEELRTGGVLKFQNGTYQADERLLIYGLGLLLVDQLERAAMEKRNLRETVAGWLEPYAEMDIKASICEFAALHALELKDFQRGAKVALLQAWIDAHNQHRETECSFTAYLPVDPQSYVELAEVIWSDAYDNMWAEEQLIFSFLRWHQSPRVSSVLISAFERWLGFVHINGYPFYHKTPEDAEKTRREISQRIGYNLQEGPFSFGDYRLTAIKDDGLLRLGRAALVIISHLTRSQFIRAIAIGCVAEAIMDFPDKYDLLAWVIRSSPQANELDILKEARHLLALNNIVAQQAAYRLLSFEGGEDAHRLRGTIPSSIFPSDPFRERHRKDPCISGFSWNAEDCLPCLQRQDLAIEWIAARIEDYCIDPDLPVPNRVKSQFSSLVEKIDTHAMGTAIFQTQADYLFDTYEPVLAAYAPNTLSDLIRSIAKQIATRQGMARRQLSFQLKQYYLIFTSEEREAIHRAWDQIVSNADTWGEAEETAEMFLFKVVLAGMTAENQLASLLRRPAKVRDLIDYTKSFLPISNWGMVSEELAHATSVKTLARILWFISAFPLSIPHDILAAYVTPLLNYEDSFVRSLVLKIIYGAKESTSIETVIQRGWRWSKSNAENENHWGSLILCENGTGISFDELLGRIDPAYLGYAVIRRGNLPLEVEIYAEAVHQVLLELTTTIPALQPDLPHFSVDSSMAADMQQVSLRGLLKDTYSRSITFRSAHATWGGTIGRELNLGEWTSIDFTERRKRLLQILRETVEQQKAAGNIWFGRVVCPTELEKIVAQRPDLTEQWVKAALSNAPDAMSLLDHSSSFYAALCAVFLRTDVHTAVALYWQIQEAGTRVHVIDKNTGIELLDFALFNASPSEVLRETWRRKLEKCDTDLDLMKLAFLSLQGTGKDWLWSYISARTNSVVPIDRARSITLLGFFDSQEAREALQKLDESLPDTWLKHLVKKSITRSKRNSWAKYWFRLFLANGDNVKAWTSFRLFLRCIDRRFWLWRRIIETDVGDSNAIKERMAFLRDNLENVHDCTRNNEKELSEQFLGQKVLKREAWPWMLAP